MSGRLTPEELDSWKQGLTVCEKNGIGVSPSQCRELLSHIDAIEEELGAAVADYRQELIYKAEIWEREADLIGEVARLREVLDCIAERTWDSTMAYIAREALEHTPNHHPQP